MKRTTGMLLVVLACAFALAGFAVWRSRTPYLRLPYAPDPRASLRGWDTFGGSWEWTNAQIINRSDERGAKILTGSESWTDYQVSADLQMTGHTGDAGLILRVTSPGIGIDSYRGYYVGARLQDSSVAEGIADDAWLERAPVTMPGGVHPGGWYRIHAVAVGCTLAAEITNLASHEQAWTAMREPHCFTQGRVGLRSTDTGAIWKNVSVRRAGPDDLAALLARAGPLSATRYPTREDELSRMRMNLPQTGFRADIDRTPEGEAEIDAGAPLQSIRSLGNTRVSSASVRIKGVVTITDPLYVQDESGGIAVRLAHPRLLDSGDEVELGGHAVVAGEQTTFQADSARLLWVRSTILPSPITSSQAASGLFEGSLVELSGEVDSTEPSDDGTIHLILSDISERFRLVIPKNLDTVSFTEPGTKIRVRGVCAGSSGTDIAFVPFTIYARNVGDVEVLSGPSWTRGRRLAWLMLAGALVALGFVWLYLKAERWRLRAVLQEREKLAIDMHDTLAQSFAGVGFQLQSMRKGLEQSGDAPPKLMLKLDSACDMAAQAHREASARILSLHPNAIAKGDLLTLIQRSALTMLNGVQLPITLRRTGQKRIIPLALSDALLRIAREAIANVLRHSGATALTLILEYRPHTVVLTIADNGDGKQMIHAGVGIESMRSRATEVGGKSADTERAG